MKKLLLSATVVAGLFAQPTIDSLQKQINSLQQQLKELKQQQQAQNDRYYKKVAPVVTNSHLFWSYDLRTTYDVISQKTTSGYGVTSVIPNPTTGEATYTLAPVNGKKYSNQILTNRVILTGVAKPADNLKATVRVEVNNMYGANDATNMMNNPYQNIPWVANETPDDITVRLKEAFFNYWFGPDNGFMFSAGRRPATEGFPANLREGDPANSPLAHLINMEFDGFSFEIGNSIFSKISDKFGDWGTWMKFCAGRGYSSATGKWPSNMGPSYSKNDALKNMDFAGFILIPYDNGQYSVKTESVWAWHVQGYQMNITSATSATASMQDFGNYFGENIIFAANGIGNGISDFLDNTTAFVSFAYSKTRPNGTDIVKNWGAPGNNVQAQAHSGHSWWIGADMPGLLNQDNDRMGINYTRGSKYWRSFTYGEDTLVGSIAAVRGHAIDAYYIHQIIPNLTTELRYTYIKYDHAGSDGFFGVMADPDVADNFTYVKTAKDLRLDIRYQF